MMNEHRFTIFKFITTNISTLSPGCWSLAAVMISGHVSNWYFCLVADQSTTVACPEKAVYLTRLATAFSRPGSRLILHNCTGRVASPCSVPSRLLAQLLSPEYTLIVVQRWYIVLHKYMHSIHGTKRCTIELLNNFGYYFYGKSAMCSEAALHS